MLSDEELRIRVKQLKVFQGISYKELAEYLEIRVSSLYNWLKCQYSFSHKRKERLEDLLDIL